MPRPQRGDAEILREAKARFQRCSDWESVARHRARIDQRIAEGDAQNRWQWEEGVLAERGGRPSLTHNKIRQHNLMIVNDARQNKAQVKVSPTGGGATYDSAQTFAGLIRRIEYQSKAIDAYSTATFHQVQTGIGYVRVVTEYESADSFDQEIYIRRVADWKTIYVDPDCKDYDKADMRFAFVFVDIPRDRFEEEHGKQDIPATTPLDNAVAADGWNDKDHIREAEYWRRNEESDTLHMLRDGRTLRESDLDDEQMEQYKPLIERSREVVEHNVEWFRIRGDKIVDRGDWAGKYIPIVPCIGEETVVDNIMDRKGHTRSQIDAQRMYNYWASAAVEQVALQSKTPYIGPMAAFENLEQYWFTANTKNHAWLPYNGKDDDGQPIPPPQRAEPPSMAQAYIEGMTLARQDLLDVTGQYQAELGMPSNERSGVAIQQRQRQGDQATYHYIDNQAKMIRQVGRILIDLIPKIYDVPKVMKVLSEDGSEQDVLLAPGASQPHQQVQMGPMGPQPITPDQQEAIKAGQKMKGILTIFNPGVGDYDVEADVGPSYGTQRQEAANAFSQIMANNPAAFQIVGDFWAQNSDFPGADELALRLRQGLPPQYKPGPDPQVAQLQQAMQAQGQQAQQLLQRADAEIAHLKANQVLLKEQQKDKGVENAIRDYEAETKRLQAIGNIDPNAMQVIVRKLVREMLQTELPGLIQHHGDMEMALQNNIQAAAPPEPQVAPGSNGQ